MFKLKVSVETEINLPNVKALLLMKKLWNVKLLPKQLDLLSISFCIFRKNSSLQIGSHLLWLLPVILFSLRIVCSFQTKNLWSDNLNNLSHSFPSFSQGPQLLLYCMAEHVRDWRIGHTKSRCLWHNYSWKWSPVLLVLYGVYLYTAEPVHGCSVKRVGASYYESDLGHVLSKGSGIRAPL